MISLDEIDTFVAVVDHGTITAAARACGYDKTAVSRKLTRLQDRLGVQLFERRGKYLRPLDVAVVLADESRALLAEATRVEAIWLRASGAS